MRKTRPEMKDARTKTKSIWLQQGLWWEIKTQKEREKPTPVKARKHNEERAPIKSKWKNRERENPPTENGDEQRQLSTEALSWKES